ncbi:MAG: gpW family protein [Betaproteobacteria bacterium]|nr:gpW family protein [Betaproteobacteria bacterium]
MSDSTIRLTEAREALHRLTLGEQVVKVEVNGAPGRSVTYTPASIESLKRYIAELELECESQPGGRRGCITFFG